MIPSVLITGGCGMVGSHLIEHYAGMSVTPVATRFRPTIDTSEVAHLCRYEACDVREASAVQSLLERHRPTIIYHLAAQSLPTVSWTAPAETIDINCRGTVNLFETIKAMRSQDAAYDPVVVVACSSAAYGASLAQWDGPATEDAAFMPLHPYGVSKAAQDMLTYQYWTGFGIRGIRARIFNTTGVRKVNDVVSDFTRRAVELEKGLAKDFPCGNLHTRRAITDVRDLISALCSLAEKGAPGEAYNISGEWIYQVSDIVAAISAETGLDIQPRIDPALLRPQDEPIIYGNSAKLREVTGWKQRVPLTQTIADMIGYWRTKI